MSREKFAPIKVLDGVHANGAGHYVDISDYKNITLSVYTSGTTTATIKFAVSNALKAPDFTLAASVTNVYDYVQISPINSQLTADKLSGSTGIALSGADIIKMYEVNSINTSNSIKWLCPIVSNYSAGTISVEVSASSDTSR